MRRVTFAVVAWSMLLSIPVAPEASTKLGSPNAVPVGMWRDLSSPHQLWPADGAIYYSLELANGSHAHLIVLNLNSKKWQLRPVVGDVTAATSTFATKSGASAAVNAGFFNLSDGATAGFIVIDGQLVADPRQNRALLENPNLAPHLESIFNRSEVRFMKDARGRRHARIMRHNEPVPQGLKLVHSIQAGPQLLPALTAREEAFVRTDADGRKSDAVNSSRGAARTALGITEDGYIMLLAVSGKGQDAESSGISLPALADLMRSLGCVEAINFDGGSSTTMFVRLAAKNFEPAANAPPGVVVCGRNPEAKVKSALLLLPAPRSR